MQNEVAQLRKRHKVPVAVNDTAFVPTNHRKSGGKPPNEGSSFTISIWSHFGVLLIPIWSHCLKSLNENKIFLFLLYSYSNIEVFLCSRVMINQIDSPVAACSCHFIWFSLPKVTMYFVLYVKWGYIWCRWQVLGINMCSG